MKNLWILLFVALLSACANSGRTTPFVASQETLNSDADEAFARLLEENDAARALYKDSVAQLVFPNIVKGGFIVGGHAGDGVLMREGAPVGHYNSVAASYGLQAGVQRFGYVLVFTNESALDYLEKSDGLEIGVGPSVVVANAGLGRNLTSTTLRADIYAFIFDQQGLMAGAGIQGTKITPIRRDGFSEPINQTVASAN